uniref:Cytochrome c oxidase assembly protein COX16 homolog, mitochondrial n=1 Tax=Steinernema glaseri TaxID=37863 RepID=A0A1I8AUP8_9BILA
MSRRGNLKFIRVGLPFFSIVFGGAFGLHYFQQVRFDFRKIKKTDDNLEFLVPRRFERIGLENPRRRVH